MQSLKHILIVTLLINFTFGEDFISEFEYGQMLYNDPRGVSCASCHGKVGEKTFIASYREDNGTSKEFYAPDIRELDLKQFKKALDSGGRIMPKYYLTDKEAEAIFKYIKSVNQDLSTREQEPVEEEPVDSNTSKEDDNITADINISEDEDIIIDDNETKIEKNDSIISKIFKTPEEEGQ